MTNKRAYQLALALAVGAALILFLMVGAVGVIGEEGDSADRMYLGVFAVGILGALIARFRAAGMARTALGMALAQAVVVVIALATGEHRSPVTSVAEIVILNGFFIAVFAASARLFHRAAVEQ